MQNTNFRHAKILATLGPSTWDEDKIEKLLECGASGFRLNFSHADAERHLQTARNVRAVAAKLGRHVPILQDLQGPKIRVGIMENPVELVRDAAITLDSDPTPGNATRVHLPHPEILEVLQPGDRFFINDGVIQLRIESKEPGKAHCRVVVPGALSSRKGVNIPGRVIPMSALTAKDRADLLISPELKPDWIALSFVQKAEDVLEAKELSKGIAPIVTKVETQAAIDNLDAIIAVSDAIMIARGDLGVELPAEDIPPLQRQIIRQCRKVGKPVIVATQMLESMITNPIPTRAEASDVAGATYAGADCLMLSAESASGTHPFEAVDTMNRIIRKAEQTKAWGEDSSIIDLPRQEGSAGDAIAAAAYHTAQHLKAACVVAFTETGNTAIRVSRWRPNLPIVGLTPHENVARRLNLVWGIQSAILAEKPNGTDDMVAKATAAAKASGHAKEGDFVVIVAGVPFGKPGTTNLIRVVEV